MSDLFYEERLAEHRTIADSYERAQVPELERHCGSWVVVSRVTGLPVLETFERSTAEAVDQRAYEVLTAAQWLGRFNASVRK